VRGYNLHAGLEIQSCWKDLNNTAAYCLLHQASQSASVESELILQTTPFALNWYLNVPVAKVIADHISSKETQLEQEECCSPRTGEGAESMPE
jgi:hypothetical protein